MGLVSGEMLTLEMDTLLASFLSDGLQEQLLTAFPPSAKPRRLGRSGRHAVQKEVCCLPWLKAEAGPHSMHRLWGIVPTRV